MKLVYRHPDTGKRVTKRFTRWSDLMDETWRVYFRALNWERKVDCMCEAGWEALDEVLP